MPSTLTVILGAGPVGTTTALQLAGAGERVRVVSRRGGGPEHPLIERQAADLADRESAIRVAAGASAVIMAVNAPYRASAWAEAFPRLQANAIAAAASAGAVLVTAENLYMYGPSEQPLRPDQPLRPSSAKGAVRARMAGELFAAHERGEVRAATVRSADYLGPFALESHVGERFVPRLLQGKGVQVVGDPDAPHAFGYVPDVARTLVAAATTERAWGRAWHAPCLELSQRQLAGEIRAAAGLPGPAKVAGLPALALLLGSVVPFVREIREMAYQFDRPFLVDWSATERELGVTATPLPEAIAATVAWFRARAAGTGLAA